MSRDNPDGRKVAPQFTKDITDRLAVGVFCVHGNIDEGLDRSHPGAMADTRVDGRDRVRFLWAHDAKQPPIAVVRSIRELTRAELPQKVLAYAPEATGGVEVTREYLSNPLADWVLDGLQKGAIQEMSYAYDVAEYSITEEDDRTIRELRKLKLFDISDVNWGLNSATVAVKSFDSVKEHSKMVATTTTEYITRIRAFLSEREKAGRVLSESNREFIKGVADQLESTEGSLAEVRKALRELLTVTEPKQAELAPPRDVVALRRLYLETQRTLAQLNGVRN